MDINGQVIVLILFVVISGIQWLIKKIQGQGDQDEPPGTLDDIYDEFREEIRQRQTRVVPPPPTAEPGQPAAVAAAPPPLPGVPAPTAAPAAPESTPPRQGQLDYYRQQQLHKPQLTDAQQAALQRFQKRGRKKSRHHTAGGPVSARALLANPRSARQAVILHEVFGKPKSMREA